MTKQSYNKIEGLEEIEWVQHRPETFIGTTSHPTHLFEEVFDNALDEVLSGGAKSVEVTINKGYCEVKDDGRGFPVGNDEKGVPYPIKACTKLYTSGKFNKGMNAYEVSAGLNGIGLVAVSALSDEMSLISYRDGYAHEYLFKTDFDKHIITHEVKSRIEAAGIGTIVSFKPSPKIFRSVDFELSYIKERIQLAKLLTDAKITLTVDGKEILVDVDRSRLLDCFFEDSIGNDTYSIKTIVDKQYLQLDFYFDMVKNEPKFKGAVNLLPIHRGTHVKYIKNFMAETLMEVMPKNSTLSKSDYLIGTRCFVSLSIKDARFSGQTKDELDINLDRFKIFEKELKEKFTKFLNTEIDLKQLYQRLLDYKLSLETKQASKKIKKRKFTSNLLDSIKYGKGTFLFLVEGDSAAGSLVKCRDRQKHAVYTLTGKNMPNVEANKASKILTNATVTDLFNVLGKDKDMAIIDDLEKVRYEYIAITTDPDIDGYHITVMVLMFFNKFFPQLIEAGRVVLPQIPLYGYYQEKVFTPIYDNEEAKRLMSGGKSLMRHKGLGEFDPEELEVILFKHSNYIVVTKESIKKMEEELILGNESKAVETMIEVAKETPTTILEDASSVDETNEDPKGIKKSNDDDLPTFDDFIF